jgi:hypothetical protein
MSLKTFHQQTGGRHRRHASADVNACKETHKSVEQVTHTDLRTARMRQPWSRGELWNERTGTILTPPCVGTRTLTRGKEGSLEMRSASSSIERSCGREAFDSAPSALPPTHRDTPFHRVRIFGKTRKSHIPISDSCRRQSRARRRRRKYRETCQRVRSPQMAGPLHTCGWTAAVCVQRSADCSELRALGRLFPVGPNSDLQCTRIRHQLSRDVYLRRAGAEYGAVDGGLNRRLFIRMVQR